MHVTCFMDIFTLLLLSGAKPAISPSYACVSITIPMKYRCYH
uniref:Uncharacterized protein n=1 Tax=Leptobrachium leishanense TaxID=445787 RepID=A0A8C5PQ83_9ANUR